MSNAYCYRDNCRVCGSRDLVLVLDLGEMPLANAFLTAEELEAPEPSYPLRLYFCRSCTLLQLLDVVSPDVLFKDYDYVTSASAPLAAHLKAFGRGLVRQFVHSSEELFVEIGGNDGTLLSAVADSARTLNIDPAENVSALARGLGIETLSKFFSDDVAREVLVSHGEARVVAATNVLAHIDDIVGVFKGIARLIGERGVAAFEVHWVGNLVDGGGFDQIYHEHLCYYSMHALSRLLAETGLTAFDVSLVPMHGESLRVFASRSREPLPSVAALMERERKLGLDTETRYVQFASAVAGNRESIIKTLRELKAAGKRIIGYGAPAKGNTLLNYCRIGPDTLEYLTDTTPQKQGRFTPGMHIPVVAPERMHARPPEYAILLAWNYKDAILKKERALREQGMKFIIPVPDVEIV